MSEKHNSLRETIKELGKVVIAYSGGVDSTFLLKVAVDTLSCENVLACIAKGPSLPQSQYTQAIEIAKNISVKVQTVEPNELADDRYKSNDHCPQYEQLAADDDERSRSCAGQVGFRQRCFACS